MGAVGAISLEAALSLLGLPITSKEGKGATL
jgi:hypothetical protein